MVQKGSLKTLKYDELLKLEQNMENESAIGLKI
jgi:hypothetical protein